MLTTRGLGTVFRDLATMGYDAEWGVLSAADVGAKHLRERIWIVGYTKLHGHFTAIDKQIISRKSNWSETNIEQFKGPSISKISNSKHRRLEKQGKYEQRINTTQSKNWQTSFPEYGSSSDFWATEPNVDRVADGVAARVDRLKAIGNGQVPLCAATAWNILKGRIDGKS